MASTQLTRTMGTATNRKIMTISCWVKRGSISNGDQNIFAGQVTEGSGDGRSFLRFRPDDKLRIRENVVATEYFILETTSKYRDCNGWYHIVVAIDTTQSTASNRIKLYVNGTQITDFSSSTYPSQNLDLKGWNNSSNHIWGNQHTGSEYFDGSMSHCHFIDGTAYDATAFGEYDANGVWKIKTSPSVTYGNNGFFILKDGNSVTDQSGNSNNFTVGGGTLTNTEDSPSNVFATWNPLSRTTGNTYSNGNTTVSYANNFQKNANATLAFNSGKYYAEFKRGGGANLHIGIVGNTFLEDGRIVNDTSSNHAYNMRGHTGAITLISNTADQNIFVDGSDSSTDVDFFTSVGDIVMVAFDADTKKIWFGKNGTWSSSGNPATGANPSYTYSGTATSDFTFGTDTENGSLCYANFGNGYFGTTAVSSAGTNASGIGIFEYDVPTGYTALSTKGLNE